MAAYVDRSLKDVLDEIAAQRAAPGGGSSAAWTCALAAGLVEMSAAFALARPPAAAVRPRMEYLRDRARQLRAEAIDLAERELHSYAPVLEALRLPPADPRRPVRLRDALGRAAEAPLAVAATGAELAELAAEAARTGSPHLRGDAVTGALLAEASCRAAVSLVEINLADQPEDARRRAAGGMARRGDAARRDALRSRCA